ncbi:hypothetical protein FOL47_006458 [Perkinsus chesapeaki]|uniref:Excision repair cross-complementing rodent repair deficiency, complementation group 6 n=1 Tax=Perkinsus chesapeaki TaxID=330153 RepID=A0A7J6MXF5_PERCH|nr:hypothetical protein FOL47_006458 [Perkinsus chesapeaki]
MLVDDAAAAVPAENIAKDESQQPSKAELREDGLGASDESVNDLDGVGKQMSQWELEMEAEREVEKALKKEKQKRQEKPRSNDSKLRDLRSRFGLEPSQGAGADDEDDSSSSSSSGSDLEIEDVTESKPVMKELFQAVRDGNTLEVASASASSTPVASPRRVLLTGRSLVPGMGGVNRKRVKESSVGSMSPSKRRRKSLARRRKGTLQLGLNGGEDVVEIRDGGEKRVVVCPADRHWPQLECPFGIWDKLFPFQKEGVRFLWQRWREGSGALLADEMGLGKTIQTTAFLISLHVSGILRSTIARSTHAGVGGDAGPGGVLIVCPATLVQQWEQEILSWGGVDCGLKITGWTTGSTVEEKRDAAEEISECSGILVVSFEAYRRYCGDILFDYVWSVCVLDEAQKIRNPDSGITQRMKRINTPHRIALSGSPIQNSLRELWSLCDFVAPGRLGSLPTFEEELATPIERGTRPNASPTATSAAYRCAVVVRDLTMPLIIRRLKADVQDILALPRKSEQVLFCHLAPEQFEVYCEVLSNVRCTTGSSIQRRYGHRIDERGKTTLPPESLFYLGILRRICNHPDMLLYPGVEAEGGYGSEDRSGKLAVCLKILSRWLPDGHRVLVFSQTLGMLDILERKVDERGWTCSRMDGSTPVKDRAHIVDDFNSADGPQVMLLSTRVGGVGLNLTGADRIIIFDPDWNPMTDAQARERAWRIGQKNEVIIYRLIAMGTVEESMYKKQIFKHYLSQKILSDPRQRRAEYWSGLEELFRVPPEPPGWSPRDRGWIKDKYALTREQSHALKDSPTPSPPPSEEFHSSEENVSKEDNGPSVEAQQLIGCIWDQDQIEEPHLDKSQVNEAQATRIADQALAAIRRSQGQVANYPSHVPTWTGKTGQAGAMAQSISLLADITADEEPVSKRAVSAKPGSAKSSISSTVESRIMDHLIRYLSLRPYFASSSSELLDAMDRYVPATHRKLFRHILQEMCKFERSDRGQGIWSLRDEYQLEEDNN